MKTTNLKSFWSSIVSKITNLWNLITKPFKKKVEPEVNELDNRFSKEFQKKAKHIKSLMSKDKVKQTDKVYLTSKLVEARKHIAENDINMNIHITDIDMLNEHNQNGGYSNMTLSEVIKKDRELSRKSLDGNLGRDLKNKAKVRWVTRS